MSNATNNLTDLSGEQKRALLAQLLQKKASQPKSFPLSFAQQRLWFLEQLRPGTTTYNTSAVLHLMGALNETAIQQSFNEIVRRHEALRTTFVLQFDQPMQRIAPVQPVDLAMIDVRTLPADERVEQARQWIRTFVQQPFDLVQGPLLRVCLVRLDAEEHVLVLAIHHIIFDNWSMGVFLREFTHCYRHFSSGAPATSAPLPPLAIQYADFAVWQREWLQSERLAAQLDYWKQHLADAPPVLALPTDRPHPPIQTFRGAVEQFALDTPLTAELKALSHAEGATLFMTLLAAFKLLLSRYSGQSSVVVGSPVAGRTRTELESLIGLFINTMALHTDLSGNPSFRELLARVKEVCLGGYAHQELPFEKLVEELQLERDLSHTIIFQAVFDLHNASVEPLELPGLTVDWWGEEVESAKFDLSLAMTDTATGLSGSIEYNTDLFDAPTVARMVDHFQVLLAGIVANPAQRVSDLPLLGATEWEELVVTRNRTVAPYPREQCFHQLFAAQVARTPDAPALIFGDQRLIYRELDQRANQLAHYLQGAGVAAEARVGICVQRSAELLIGLLGIFKAGGAFVPLDPGFPAERMAYILEDAGVSILLTQERLIERLPTHLAQVVALDTAWPEIATLSRDDPGAPVTGANLAYLIYTSGSTGRPKGVLIPHYGLNNYLVWCQQPYTVAQGRGAPVHASIAADAIFPSLFAPLLAGTSVVVMPEEQALEALGQSLVREGNFSMVKITPSQLEVMTHDLPATDASGWVKTFVIGAEEVRGEVLTFWQRHAPATRLLNEYGPTETVVGCSIYEVPQGTAIAGTVPIGLPIANIQFYVLDPHMQPVPIGVPGELYIGGDGVAWGYHNRPALTAEKFVPDPFSKLPGARLYKTGDLVRAILDRAGNVEFLGRIDDQVKIRGYRVEPGEVGEVLLQNPAVRETVVLAREDTPGHKRLVAYVVASASPPPTAAMLRDFLLQHVPEYMVPAAFVFLDALPLAPHGKIDRKALPAPDHLRADQAAEFVAPRNELERELAHLWERILGTQPIGVTDSFFDLGGHSLLVVRLMSQIEHQFGQAIPLSAIFQGATVEHLAALLQQDSVPAPWTPLVAIKPQGSKAPFFCVHPVGGNVLSYATIAHYLDPEQPMYGLQAPDLADAGEDIVLLEDMAAQYVEAIQSVDPNGPYQLGGWSLGGLIAFEMAQQLQRQGKQVSLLAMIDSRPPATIGRAADITDATVLAMMAREQALQTNKPLSIEIDALQELDPAAQLDYVLAEIRKVGLDLDTELAWVRRFVRGFRAREQSVHLYQPTVYDGTITLFKTSDEDAEILRVREMMGTDLVSPTYGWDELSTRPVEIRMVAGYHGMLIMEPYVQVVAQQLQECLNQAQRSL